MKESWFDAQMDSRLNNYLDSQEDSWPKPELICSCGWEGNKEDLVQKWTDEVCPQCSTNEGLEEQP